jgi:protein-S-isoprenylcysteine O-methyltransferase Ste14
MSQQDTPGIHFPPPLMFFLAGIGGLWLGRKTGWLTFVPSSLIESMALGLIGLGFVLGTWALFPFFLKGTSPLPWESDTKLLTEGPYRFSRNPMYAAMALVYIGICLQTGSGLALLLLLPLILIINRFVIAGEEVYLLRTFGTAYQTYCQTVRRWL